MVPIVRIVDGHSGDWAVMYFVSNISDRKIWEGHMYEPNSICALCETFGYPIEFWEFTDEDEIDGCTPDTWAEIKGKKRIV